MTSTRLDLSDGTQSMARQGVHRDALIETAMRLFRRQGYAASGLVQITETSGAPKGSLYHYFPHGKQQLAAEAVALAGAQVAEMLRAHLDRTTTFPEFARAVTNIYADWMAEGDYRSGCPIATTMLECAPSSVPITRSGRDGFDQWLAIIVQALRRDGVPTAEAEEAATAFVSALEGALILARVRQDAAPLRAVAAHFSVPPALTGATPQ